MACPLLSHPGVRAWILPILVGPATGRVVGCHRSGIVQGGSLLMIILGLTMRQAERVPVRADSERDPRLYVDLMPSPGGARLGLTLTYF